MHAHQVGLRCDSGGTIFAAAARSNAQHMRCVAAKPGIRVRRMVSKSGVWVFLLECLIDCVAVMDHTVVKWLRRAGTFATTLIPQSQNPRAAILVSKIWVRKVKSPVHNSNHHTAAGGFFAGGSSFVRRQDCIGLDFPGTPGL